MHTFATGQVNYLNVLKWHDIKWKMSFVCYARGLDKTALSHLLHTTYINNYNVFGQGSH